MASFCAVALVRWRDSQVPTAIPARTVSTSAPTAATAGTGRAKCTPAASLETTDRAPMDMNTGCMVAANRCWSQRVTRE